MGNRRRIKVGVDTLPIPASSGSAPDDAPYLLNGVDPSGSLTAQVNVLTLTTPQPFIATAPIAGDVGLPITLAYDNGAGTVGTGVGLQFKAQNDADTTQDICTVIARLTDATDTSEDSEVDIQVLAAGADQTALTISNSGLTLDGTGNKSIDTTSGDLIVTTTGGNFTAGSAGRTNNLSTFLASATTGAIATLKAEVTGTPSDTKLDVNANKTAQFTKADTITFAPDGATQTLTTGSALSIVGAGVTIDSGAANLTLRAGGSDRWIVDDTSGELQAQGGGAKITNVDPGTTTGDVVVFEQILDAGVATPVDAGPAVAIVPGASFIATSTFTAPNAAAGNFLLQNNTGKTITLIGARVLIPGAATTLSINVFNGATSLFFAAAITGPGGGHLSCTASYSLATAAIANGDDITVVAAGAAATVDTILFLEYIVQ